MAYLSKSSAITPTERTKKNIQLFLCRLINGNERRSENFIRSICKCCKLMMHCHVKCFFYYSTFFINAWFFFIKQKDVFMQMWIRIFNCKSKFISYYKAEKQVL